MLPNEEAKTSEGTEPRKTLSNLPHAGAAATIDRKNEISAQMVLADGLPAAVGGIAAMGIVGFSIVPALAFGVAAGAAYTVLRQRLDP